MASDAVPSWVFSLLVALARNIRWKHVLPRFLAGMFGVLLLKVEDLPTKAFRRSDGQIAYTMLQLWVANDSGLDAEKVRCYLNWRRKGGRTLDGQTTPGLWCKKLGTGLAGYPAGVTEQVDLLSNGDDQHLGLVVKAPGSREAYIVAPGSYHAGPQYPDYQHPSFMLAPGAYEVDIVFMALGGKKGLVRLEIQHSGSGSDVIASER